MRKKIIVALLVIVVIVGAWYLLPRDSSPVACTEEAKVCKDGSTVGRSGKQCQFDPCPEDYVSLFYYNPALDTDVNGTVLCSEKGLVAVKRVIPDSEFRINATMRALINGELTAEEKTQGITTEFPLAGLTYLGSSRTGGKLQLSFADPQHKTSGGSCRVSVLRAQIEKTAAQFPGVAEVFIDPEELFQP